MERQSEKDFYGSEKIIFPPEKILACLPLSFLEVSRGSAHLSFLTSLFSSSMIKPGILFYPDKMSFSEKLSDDQLGKLFRACMKFHNGEEVALPFELELVFDILKSQFLKDEEEYKNLCEKRSHLGKIGAQKRWGKAEESQEMANDSKGKEEMPTAILAIPKIASDSKCSQLEPNRTEPNRTEPNFLKKEKEKEKSFSQKISESEEILKPEKNDFQKIGEIKNFVKETKNFPPSEESNAGAPPKTDEQAVELWKEKVLEKQWVDHHYIDKTLLQSEKLSPESKVEFIRKVRLCGLWAGIPSLEGRAKGIFHEICGLVNDKGDMERVLSTAEAQKRKEFEETFEG